MRGAGIRPEAGVDAPLAEWQAVRERKFRVRVLSAVDLARRATGHLRQQDGGRIINMASLAGQNGGTATGGHYAASKGAILTTTKIFARELAGQGVTVNAISPGPHDLPIVHQTVPAEKLDQVIAGIPVRRLGDPAFIAKTVSLLADEDAAFVTGACWDINGGLYVR